MRQHDILAQQPHEIAIGLDQRRSPPPQKARLQLAHDTGEQRCQQQHQQHLRALHGEFDDHCHIASTSSRNTRAAKTRLRNWRMVRNWRWFSRSAAKPMNAATGANSPSQIRSRSCHREPRRSHVAGRRHLDCSRAGKRRCRRRGGSAGRSSAVYWVSRARVGITAIPRRGAAQPVRRQAVDRPGGDRARYDHEDEDQEAVIGAAALDDRHDREPVDARLYRHARRRRRLCTTGASASMKKPGRIPATRQSAAKNMAASEKRSVSCAARPPACGRGRGIVTPKALTKHAAGQCGRQREERADRRHEQLQAPGRQLRAEQDRLEGQPFGDEAVERRQRRDGDAADQEHEGGLWHAVDQAAEMLHVAFAGRVQHRAGAEEQQALEDRMIEHVQERGGERQRRRRAPCRGPGRRARAPVR